MNKQENPPYPNFSTNDLKIDSTSKSPKMWEAVRITTTRITYLTKFAPLLTDNLEAIKAPIIFPMARINPYFQFT
jgi:hypothetical protein